jgi:hypothetical protein
LREGHLENSRSGPPFFGLHLSYFGGSSTCDSSSLIFWYSEPLTVVNRTISIFYVIKCVDKQGTAASGRIRMKTSFLFMMVLPLLAMLGVPESTCSKCGTRRIGWALRNPRYQTCPKCGAALEIKDSGGRVSTGHSPFIVHEHLIDRQTDVSPSCDTKQENCVDRE